MLNTITYGSVLDLIVANKLYPRTFEVIKMTFRGSFNDNSTLVKCLLFSGSFLGGHYDIQLPLLNTL